MQQIKVVFFFICSIDQVVKTNFTTLPETADKTTENHPSKRTSVDFVSTDMDNVLFNRLR